MSDMFRNLSNQGAQSSRQNTEWWLDLEQKANAAKAKKAAGQTLTKEEQGSIGLWDLSGEHYKQKAKEQGIESTKSVSESTGVPDLTDKAAQARKMSQAMQVATGRGRRQSMMNGEYDDSMLGGF